MTEPAAGFRIWIDADAAPIAIKQIVFKAAMRLGIETILVANRPVPIPAAAKSLVRGVVVRDGPDQADRYMVLHSEAADIAITADIPLAADLVEKSVDVIDPRGEQYSASNIRGRLSMRNFLDDLRSGGVQTGGAAPFGEKDKRAFAATFDRLLAKRRLR